MSQERHSHPCCAPQSDQEDIDAAQRMTVAKVDVMREIARAQELGFGPFHSAHEGYAILLEEVDELKAHVWTNQKKRDVEAMYKEAVQVAAMATKFAAQCRKEGWARL